VRKVILENEMGMQLMAKYFVILVGMLLFVACDEGGTKDPVDNQPADDNTVITDDSALADNGVDTEQTDSDNIQPDDTVDNEPTDVLTDTTQPDDIIDTTTPDADSYSGPDDIGAMMDVPAGEFMMGCNEAVDAACESGEYPYHAVTLSAYKIGKYEVTIGEYQKCVDAGDCNNDNNEEPHYATVGDHESCNLGTTGNESYPVQCVTWYGAKAYCEWLGGRLPTEAEWEKAARGTDGRKYPWGNEPTVSCDYAVMYDIYAGCGTGGPMPVGSKEAGKSLYGVYDMIGNVQEWVNDWYDEDYYGSSPTSDPTGPESGSSVDYRAKRGGAWSSTNDHVLRASSRSGLYPGSYGIYGDGFRCAK